jgi:NAD(P)-dependent dehydrogenase (short-subunit alcohol dehydrogenase family)
MNDNTTRAAPRRRLEGRRILITGASSGIGRAIALHFGTQGARLVLADVTDQPREGGQTTLALLRSAGVDAYYIETDVSSESAAQAAVDETVARFGGIDVLVNDAAINTNHRLTDTSLDEWNRVMSVNLTGVFLMSRAAIRAMLMQPLRLGDDGVQQTRGRIVNVSSQHGMVCAPNNVAYGTSKAGVVYLTKQVAVDYAHDGIVCNAVAPGKVLTGKPGPAGSPEAIAYSQARTPMPRLGRPEDVAGAALFLASDDASYITGENLLVDGGWMAA